MAWGIQTWDARGVPNNYGLTPITVVGKMGVGFEQVSGAQSFNLPSGFALDYIQCPTQFLFTQKRRLIQINGGNVIITEASSSNFGFGSESAQSAFIVFYLRKI